MQGCQSCKQKRENQLRQRREILAARICRLSQACEAGDEIACLTLAQYQSAENSEWKRWSADTKAQAAWATPVQPRRASP